MNTARFPKTMRFRPAATAAGIVSLMLAGAALPPASAMPSPAGVYRVSDDAPPAEKASISSLVPVELPEGAMRTKVQDAVDQFREVLTGLYKEKNRSVSDVEILFWKGSAAAKKEIPTLLSEAGYKYAEQDRAKQDGAEITQILVTHKKSGREVAGVWMEKDGSILLAWGRLSSGASAGDAPAARPASSTKPASSTQQAAAKPAGNVRPASIEPAGIAGSAEPIVLDVDARTMTLNVMGRAVPRPPAFPSLSPKPGTARGYVYDAKGRPLKGARIGVRSTAVGGFYSGSAATTDEKGYYEVQAPSGVAHFYCAGYAVDYGEGRAALGLFAADGEASQFASPNGLVENFVLAPFGIADRDGVQEDPRYLNNYFGGNVILSWYVDDDPRYSDGKSLPPGSIIEMTLTPQGPLVDGSPARPIVIRKRVESGGATQLYINNIPVTEYRISMKLAGGAALKMKEVGPNGNKMFGLTPKEAAGTAAFQLRPGSAKLEYAVASKGNWDQVCIAVER